MLTTAGALQGAISIQRGALLVLISGLPAFHLWGITLDAFNTPKLALLIGLVGIASGARLVEAFASGRWTTKSALALPALLLAGPLLLSWILNPNKAWGVLGEPTRYEGIAPYLLVIAAGSLTAHAFKGRPLPVAWAMVAGGSVVGSYALVQALGLDPLEMPLDPYLASTVGHGNFVGGFLAIVLPITMIIWIGGLRGSKIAALCTVPIALGIALSLSQGGWAAGVAGSAVAVGLLAQGKFKKAPAVGGLVALIVALAVLGNVVLAAVAPDNPLVGGTTRARAEWWKSTITMAADSPIWGHGPNAYALESPRYRTELDGLSHGNLLSNAPHSVPLSFLANTGALGFAGFVGVLLWALIIARRRLHQDALTGAFLAGAAAYLVQSLVSLDQLLITFALWVCLAGIGASSEPATQALSPVRKPHRYALPLGILAAALLMLSGIFISTSIIWADVEAARGARSFNSGEVERGSAQLRRALDLLDSPSYRFILGARLGSAALDEGAQGRHLLEEMRQTLKPLREMGHLHSMLSEGRSLQLWSIRDPLYAEEALRVLEVASALDPHNPELVVWLAETHLLLGQQETAIEELQEFTTTTMDSHPRVRSFTAPVWAVLSIAEHQLGRAPDARAHLGFALADAHATGVETSNCEVVIARVFVGEEQDLMRIPDALGCPDAVRAALDPGRG